MKRWFPLCALVLLSACNNDESKQGVQSLTNNTQQPSTVTFNEARFRNDIKTLASDEFEGRAPTTKGEKLTIEHLAKAFSEMGLKPAYNGSYFQPVPMVSYTASETQTVKLGQQTLTHRDDIVLGSRTNQPQINITNAPLVFVGYGINAPEYDWNDYQGLDMAGKVAVILVNDPGFAHPEGEKFNGKAMTYYGRWNYKFEEASRQGALGAIIIHDTKPASYPWSVVENSWTGPQQDLAQQANVKGIDVEGWISLAAATTLFESAGLSLENVSDRAASGPLNIPLEQQASIAFANQVEYADSFNVVATLPGAEQADEHILFTAHWDHLGKDGNDIYNGALDNASGTAGIVEIARMYAQQAKNGQAVKRSITFIATTGEEQGLLGSRHYAENPIYPLAKTVAVFNVDSTNIYGQTKDYTIIGKGQSELEHYLISEVEQQQRVATRESRPESGGFFRSDHFSFVKKGVPAVFAGGGSQPIDDATAQYKANMRELMKGCYHNVCDEYREEWQLDGAIQDLMVYYHASRTLADSNVWPGFYPTSEFHSLRPAGSTEK